MLRLTGKAPAHVDPNYVRSPNPVVYDDAEGKGMRFEAAVQAIAEGGTMRADGQRLRIEGARAVTLLDRRRHRLPRLRPRARPLRRRHRRRLPALASMPRARKTTPRLRAAHIADHQKLFRRVTLESAQARAAGTAHRRTAARRSPTQPDPDLVALYFQYGRYLLIASSRPGSQPANLQGIWNELVRPPWSSNWTANINVQMNYWPAETCNLAECHEPLFDLIEGLSQNRRADGADELRMPRLGVASQRGSLAAIGAGGRFRAGVADLGELEHERRRGSARTCGSTTRSAATANSCARGLIR